MSQSTSLILPPSVVNWTQIELPPDLPMPVFTSNDAWNSKRVGALAIYCSDGRWGEAFDEFCHRSLEIPRYDRFAVPGGPAWIAQDRGQTDLLSAAHGQIDFLVRHHSLERIVLITHWGCAFYSDEGKRSARDAWPDQLREIEAAAANLRLWFAGVAVECYLAMQIDGRISFHQVGVKPAVAAIRLQQDAVRIVAPSGHQMPFEVRPVVITEPSAIKSTRPNRNPAPPPFAREGERGQPASSSVHR